MVSELKILIFLVWHVKWNWFCCNARFTGLWAFWVVPDIHLVYWMLAMTFELLIYVDLLNAGLPEFVLSDLLVCLTGPIPIIFPSVLVLLQNYWVWYEPCSVVWSTKVLLLVDFLDLWVDSYSYAFGPFTGIWKSDYVLMYQLYSSGLEVSCYMVGRIDKFLFCDALWICIGLSL
jgi:hypothetical protein